MKKPQLSDVALTLSIISFLFMLFIEFVIK